MSSPTGREGTVPSGGGTKARREGGREASVPIEGKWSHGRTQTDKKAAATIVMMSKTS